MDKKPEKNGTAIGMYAGYEIKRLPIPRLRRRVVRYPPPKYPFPQLVEPGMCFPLLFNDDHQAVRVAAERYGNRHGMEFIVRSTDGGFICWRTR